MATYRYRAVDKTGRPARGSLDAINITDLELRLRRMGLDLITCSELRKSSPWLVRGRISRQDLITFCFHLEQIARSGIPLLEGLTDLRETMTNPRFREVVTNMLEDMEGGKLLSQAMANYPGVFDHLFVSLIKAGEQTGNLPDVLNSLAGTLRWQDEIIGQTQRLLIYPSLVLVVVGGVITFLLLQVVPQLISFLKTMGETLPLQTRVLIFLSDGFSHYWPFLFGLPLVAVIALWAGMIYSPKVRYFMDYAKLRLPFFGPILQKVILARFANFFALMYRSGITILDSMTACEGIVDNRVISDSLRRAAQRINAGDGLTESFQNLGVFPPLVLRMLRIGETTGALDGALLNITYFYNRDVQESIERLLKILEPALITFLGLFMALILFSVLTPIYDILGKIKV